MRTPRTRPHEVGAIVAREPQGKPANLGHHHLVDRLAHAGPQSVARSRDRVYHPRLMDEILRAIAGDGVRVVSISATATCREAALRHACAPGAAVALGRACTAAALLATLTKGGERVTVQILGQGPLGTVAADANDAGDIRGYVSRTAIPLPEGDTGRARLGPLVGTGLVSVLRDLGLKEVYQGALTLASGEIDEDLERYLIESEQLESALGCEVVVGAGDGGVAAAAGVLVQCLPGGDVAAVGRARERLRAGVLHAALAGGTTDAVALARLVSGAELAVLDTRPVRFRCRCSRERVTSALLLCGAEELEAMKREDGGAEVTCNFCATRYRLDQGELARLLDSLAQA
jgi:molecular chaperone Hsp33